MRTERASPFIARAVGPARCAVLDWSLAIQQ